MCVCNYGHGVDTSVSHVGTERKWLHRHQKRWYEHTHTHTSHDFFPPNFVVFVGGGEEEVDGDEMKSNSSSCAYTQTQQIHQIKFCSFVCAILSNKLQLLWLLLWLMIFIIPTPHSAIHIIIPICLFLHRYVPFVLHAYTCLCVPVRACVVFFEIWTFEKLPIRRFTFICALRIPNYLCLRFSMLTPAPVSFTRSSPVTSHFDFVDISSVIL